MSNVGNEDELCCLQTLRDFYGGFWMRLTVDDIDVQFLQNGFVNRSYKVRVKESLESKLKSIQTDDQCLPTRVFIRYYGCTNNDMKIKETVRNFTTEAEETLITDRLSSKNLTPKIYGLIPNGRIEELIEGEALTREHLESDDEIFESFVRQLVKFHLSKEIPITKTKRFMPMMHETLCFPKPITDNVLTKFTNVQTRNKILEYCEFNIENELKWFERCFERVRSPIVLTHHDCRVENILVLSKPIAGERIVFVDIEFTSFAARGLDLGYFCSTFNTSFSLCGKLIYINQEDANLEEFEKKFVLKYLEYLKKFRGFLEPNVDTLEHLLMELRLYFLLPTINYIIMHRNTIFEDSFVIENLNFRLLEHYKKRKDWLVKKYNDLLGDIKV